VRRRLEADVGIRARFVLGHWPGDPFLERAADGEEAQAGDILRLQVAETYENLPMKVWHHSRCCVCLAACGRMRILQHSIAQVLVQCVFADVVR